MPSRKVVVGSSSGLHARPAALFVKAATAVAPIKIKIGVEGKKPVNAASMLGVLSLGAHCGAEVELECDDDSPEAEQALDELARLLESDLDADDG